MISAAELWCQLSCQLYCLSRHQSGVESVTSSFLFAVCKGFLEARDQSRKGPRRCISEETVRCSFGFRLHSERQLSRRKEPCSGFELGNTALNSERSTARLQEQWSSVICIYRVIASTKLDMLVLGYIGVDFGSLPWASSVNMSRRLVTPDPFSKHVLIIYFVLFLEIPCFRTCLGWPTS